MRLLIATLAFIAVTASGFVIWPVVADAPWEKTSPSSCELLAQQLADTDIGSIAIFREEPCY